eukprot:48884-Eustigmatos_ZCMA.PRE.1
MVNRAPNIRICPTNRIMCPCKSVHAHMHMCMLAPVHLAAKVITDMSMSRRQAVTELRPAR